MRIRTLKPEFWAHEELSAIHPEAALLAIGLLNYADDEGFFCSNPKLIAAAIFPIRQLSAAITEHLTTLECLKWIERTTGTNGREYGKVCNFKKHQVVNRPKSSKIRPFWPGQSTDQKAITDKSVTDPEQITHQSPPEQGTGSREQWNQGTGNNAGGREGVVSGNGLQLLETLNSRKL